MSIRLSRPIAAIPAAVALVSMVPGVVMGVKGPVVPSGAAVRGAVAAAPGQMFVVTGDRLLGGGSLGGRAAGRGALSSAGVVIPGGRGGGSLLSLRAGGHTYAIPGVALPYLGHGLAAGLFDVGALARAEAQVRVQPLPLRPPPVAPAESHRKQACRTK